MKAIVVARVSTEEQKEAGNSLPGQTHRIEKYFERLGHEIVDQFSIDESAYKDKRDDFDRIVAYVRKFAETKKEKLLVGFDKVDRLTRNMFDERVSALYQMASQGQIELHFVSDGQVVKESGSATEKFQFGMSISLAKYYSDAISDTVKRAQEQKIRKGEYPAASPFGYKNVDIDEKKWIVPHEHNSYAVKAIFNWYTSSSFSMSEIVEKLKHEFRLKKSKSMVAKILKDKFYIGIMTWNGIEYPHQYEKLIEQRQFDKAQQIMSGRTAKNNRFKYAGKPAAYRGLFKCHECGCSMTYDPKKRKLTDGSYNTHIYYRCTNYHRVHDKVINVKESEIDEQLAELFKQLELPPEKLKAVTNALRESHQHKNEFYENRLDFINKEINRYNQRRRKAYEDHLDGRITVNLYDEINSDAEKNISSLQEELSKLNHAENEYYLTTARLVELGARTAEIFLRSKPLEKRQLINLVLSNGTIEGKKLRYTVKFPFNLVLENAPSFDLLPR